MAPEETVRFGDPAGLEVEALPALGGRIHRIRAFGHDLLRTPNGVGAHSRAPFLWGAYVMVPWCNRVRGASFSYGGHDVALRPNMADTDAIHGLATERPWRLDRDDRGVTMSITTDGSGFPWRHTATASIDVDGPTANVRLSVRNDSDETMPAGIGLHPWFTTEGGLAVRLPAERAYPHPADQPSPDEPVAVSGPLDLRASRPVVSGIDHCFTDLAEPLVELRWVERGIVASMRLDATADHVVVAAFDRLAAVAVEPQTHALDGHRRLINGERGAIAALPPGESLTTTITLDVVRT